MSRVTQSRPAPASALNARADSGISGDAQDEVCPVCKSSRYLNASLRFLVNPECYHKMCESCVDRIFSHGPAQCPIGGCRRTLRKHRFREQTFEDIAVEREVDVRRRVAAAVGARREADFETLRDFNDYLNDVEDITFNLIHGIDLDETNRRFEQFRAAAAHEAGDDDGGGPAHEPRSYAALQKAEREQARLRREAARREDAEERREREESRRDVRRRLESGEDAEEVLKASGDGTDSAVHDGSSGGGGGGGGSGVTLKKRMNRQAAAERAQQLQAAAAAAATAPGASGGADGLRNGSGNMVIKGLKARPKAAPEAPVDPFGGLSFDSRSYFRLRDDYVWNVLQDAKVDPMICAGGYDIASFSTRALTEAFSGLGVFLADEMTERDRSMQHPAEAGTAGAAHVAQDVVMED